MSELVTISGTPRARKIMKMAAAQTGRKLSEIAEEAAACIAERYKIQLPQPDTTPQPEVTVAQ